MNLLKSKLSVGIAIGLLSGPALAVVVECTVIPVNSIITEGQTLQLRADCNGALDKVNWKMDDVSVTGDVALDGHAANQPLYFTTPVGLGGSNRFAFTVTGTPGTGNSWGSATVATVVVKPSSAALARALGNTNPETPANASCGTAAGSAVQNMPTGTSQCSTGSKAALVISGPQSFTWSCLSLTGGTDANCYALRGNAYTITTTAGAGGSISPFSPLVNANTSASFSITANPGYTIASVTGCGGSLSGNTYTTGAITNACTVSATFAVPESSYTVTATAGPGGSISPAGTQAVNANANTSFTVAAATGYAISGVTGCSGSLAGNTYTTGAITNACTVAASFVAQPPPAGGSSSDPGVGSGLWVPPGTTNRVVADQSGSTIQYLTSYVPGCLNGDYITTASASGCGGKTSYTGTVSGTEYTFAFGSGKILSLRYRSKSTAGTSVKYFTLASGDGGNVGQNVRVWLNTDPTATYDATNAACKSTSNTQPYVLTGPGYCPVTPNTTYYLSMSVDAACTTCRYKVEEGASDFQ